MTNLLEKIKGLNPKFSQKIVSKPAIQHKVGGLADTVIDKEDGTFNGAKVLDEFVREQGKHPALKDWKLQSVKFYLKERSDWNHNLYLHQKKYYIPKPPSFFQAPYFNPFLPLQAQPFSRAEKYLSVAIAAGMALIGGAILLEEIQDQAQEADKLEND